MIETGYAPFFYDVPLTFQMIVTAIDDGLDASISTAKAKKQQDAQAAAASASAVPVDAEADVHRSESA